MPAPDISESLDKGRRYDCPACRGAATMVYLGVEKPPIFRFDFWDVVTDVVRVAIVFGPAAVLYLMGYIETAKIVAAISISVFYLIIWVILPAFGWLRNWYFDYFTILDARDIPSQKVDGEVVYGRLSPAQIRAKRLEIDRVAALSSESRASARITKYKCQKCSHVAAAADLGFKVQPDFFENLHNLLND
jgi:hypothetical protein